MRLLVFLSLFNWKMFSRISITFGRENHFYVPRIFLISPLLLLLCYEAYARGVAIRVLMIFLLSNLMMEIARVSNRCFYDPIHFFFYHTDFKNKFISIWLSEFLGVKFSLLVIYIWIGTTIEGSIVVMVSLLMLAYVLLVTAYAGLSIIGNRIKVVSSVYQWALIMIFSFLIASLGIFTDGVDFLPLTMKVESWTRLHFERMVLVGSLTAVSVFLLTLFVSQKVYKERPFINPASFPKKMI